MLAIAIVRDCFEGREMARVLSIIFAVFIIVPVFAPAIGGLFLLFGEWQVLFASMLALALVLAVWFGFGCRRRYILNIDCLFLHGGSWMASG